MTYMDQCPNCGSLKSESKSVEHVADGQLNEVMQCLGECEGSWVNECKLWSKMTPEGEPTKVENVLFEVDLMRTAFRVTTVRVSAPNALRAVEAALNTSDPEWGSERDFEVTAEGVRRLRAGGE